jgi:uncharacterized SAM-binding protein YcdF (DUF218 family)
LVPGIIALGGGIDPEVAAARDQLAINEETERLVTLATLARRYPQARLAFSGGSGELFGSGTSEAAVIKRILMGLGVDLDRVVFEDRSRNTFENARYSKDLIAPKPDECWLLITSAYHMPRAVGVLQKVGWDVLPHPVAYRATGAPSLFGRLDFAGQLEEFDLAVHSWLGLLAYDLMDRSSALLPRLYAPACGRGEAAQLATHEPEEHDRAS